MFKRYGHAVDYCARLTIKDSKGVTRVMGMRPERSHTHKSNTHTNYLMTPHPFYHTLLLANLIMNNKKTTTSLITCPVVIGFNLI